MKNGAIKIDKGIPVPQITGRGHGKGPTALAMLEMKKGDSIFLRCSKANIYQSAGRYIGKGKYAIRTEKDGFRVWRIA